jgi:two-component system cell cycle response regulator DivK
MTPAGKRILIVDDDRDFVEAMQALLEANGFTVLKARNGREGVKLARMERPDLILMDIMMDERTEGFFTIQEMRHQEELKGVPIFVLSSLYAQIADFGTVPDRAWLADDEFFSKPVDMARLVETIRQRIGQPALKKHESA